MTIKSYKEEKIVNILDGYAEIGRMLNGLLNSLEKKLSSPNPESQIPNP